jgi:DNA-binding response OmpR family regulator
MLTARSRPEDVLKGFESGADDYLPKPFELSVLMARIHALLRRREWLRHIKDKNEQPATVVEPPDEVYKFDGKTIDLGNLELRTDKQTVRLTLMEAQLLRYLIKHEGEIVKRKAMLEEVWGLHEDTDTRAIDNFIVRLRRYIENEPSRPQHLLTVRGLGYRFVRGSGD